VRLKDRNSVGCALSQLAPTPFRECRSSGPSRADAASPTLPLVPIRSSGCPFLLHFSPLLFPLYRSVALSLHSGSYRFRTFASSLLLAPAPVPSSLGLRFALRLFFSLLLLSIRIVYSSLALQPSLFNNMTH
jgi:hypothetical protein